MHRAIRRRRAAASLLGSRSSRSCRWLQLNPFEYRCDALTDADAHRGQGIPAVTTPQLVKQRRRDARAAGAKRMAQRYRATVDVRSCRVELQLAHTRDRLGGKGFVDFDEIELRR